MDYITATITSAVNMSALLCMLFYSRRGASFKRHISLLAWLLMVAATFNLFRIWTAIGHTYPVTYSEAVWQLLLFIPIILNKGNVSFLIPKEGFHENIRSRA